MHKGEELPSYFDAGYGCQMEILRFESAAPNPRFEVWIQGLTRYLATASVLSDHTSIGSLQTALNRDNASVPSQWSDDHSLAHSIR